MFISKLKFKPATLFIGITTIILSSLTGCFDIQPTYQKFEGLAPGTWKLALDIQGETLPVLVEVHNSDSNNAYIELINGTQRTKSKAIQFYSKMAKDSAKIVFEGQNSTLLIGYEADVLEGVWIDHNQKHLPIPVYGRLGYNDRFKNPKNPTSENLNKSFELSFKSTERQNSKGKLSLKQTNNQLVGTLQIDSMTYNTVEGIVRNDELLLSYFDAKDFCLIKAKIQDGKLIQGKLWLNQENIIYWDAK